MKSETAERSLYGKRVKYASHQSVLHWSHLISLAWIAVYKSLAIIIGNLSTGFQVWNVFHKRQVHQHLFHVTYIERQEKMKTDWTTNRIIIICHCKYTLQWYTHTYTLISYFWSMCSLFQRIYR